MFHESLWALQRKVDTPLSRFGKHEIKGMEMGVLWEVSRPRGVHCGSPTRIMALPVKQRWRAALDISRARSPCGHRTQRVLWNFSWQKAIQGPEEAAPCAKLWKVFESGRGGTKAAFPNFLHSRNILCRGVKQAIWADHVTYTPHSQRVTTHTICVTGSGVFCKASHFTGSDPVLPKLVFLWNTALFTV